MIERFKSHLLFTVCIFSEEAGAVTLGQTHTDVSEIHSKKNKFRRKISNCRERLKMHANVDVHFKEKSYKCHGLNKDRWKQMKKAHKQKIKRKNEARVAPASHWFWCICIAGTVQHVHFAEGLSCNSSLIISAGEQNTMRSLRWNSEGVWQHRATM